MDRQTVFDHLNDLIDRWHEGNDPRPLHEALGMTLEEYNLFSRNSQNLPERFLLDNLKLNK